MIRKFFLTGMILLVIGITIAGIQVAFAQETSAIEDVDDNTVIVIVIAAAVGGFVAPIVGYAANKEDSFNWKQYTMAVTIILPSTLALIMAEIIVLEMSVSNAASVVVIFIMVFLQALGIDYGKSRAKKAINNK